jgi:hypothetical protein
MTTHSGAPQFMRRGGLALVVFVILTVYSFEAHGRRQITLTPASQSDQDAYLNYARYMSESGYAFVGDRNRMPVFPFLLSLIHRPNLTETQFLIRAQSFNIILKSLIILLLFQIFRKTFSPLYAVALLVATAFGVFIYRTPLVQAEVLFYFLSFCAFLFLVRMLFAPQWWHAVFGGAMVGLAYLTKASILPMLGIWVAVFFAQSFLENRAAGKTLAGTLLRRLGLLLLVIGTFGAVTFPYLRTSKQIYGHYFYNVNSTFYMWCDSWPEALAFTRKYDTTKWPALPADEIPSAVKYWREHSAAQIAQRLMNGLKTLATRSAKPVGYYKFVFLLGVTAVVLTVQQPQLARKLIVERAFAASFCFLFFFFYVLLYAWYDAVVTDSRFILSLFLPFMFAASKLVLNLGKDWMFVIARRQLSFTQLLTGALIGLAFIDVAYNALRIARLMS